jgi:hypothetical protein
MIRRGDEETAVGEKWERLTTTGKPTVASSLVKIYIRV